MSNIKKQIIFFHEMEIRLSDIKEKMADPQKGDYGFYEKNYHDYQVNLEIQKQLAEKISLRSIHKPVAKVSERVANKNYIRFIPLPILEKDDVENGESVKHMVDHYLAGPILSFLELGDSEKWSRQLREDHSTITSELIRLEKILANQHRKEKTVTTVLQKTYSEREKRKYYYSRVTNQKLTDGQRSWARRWLAENE